MNVEKQITDMTFEESLAELEAIVGTLEGGQAPLDQSISSYERGMALKKQCEAKLREAQSKIEKITVNDDGSLKAEPFNAA